MKNIFRQMLDYTEQMESGNKTLNLGRSAPETKQNFQTSS